MGPTQVDLVEMVNKIISSTSILVVCFDFFDLCILFNLFEYFGFKVGVYFFYVLQRQVGESWVEDTKPRSFDDIIQKVYVHHRFKRWRF